MRIREPRELRSIGLLVVWAVVFGGVPLVVLLGGAEPTGGDQGGSVLLVLFPVVATGVVGVSMRRWLRSGFRLTEAGIDGAHDAEGRVVPWSDVAHVEWRHARPTSTVRINGRPLPSGPALFAVRRDGGAVRLMQACAPRPRQQRRIEEQVRAAAAAGLLPVPFRAGVMPEHGGRSGVPGPGAGPPVAARGSGEVRRWSSTGRGEPVPRAGGGDGGLRFELPIGDCDEEARRGAGGGRTDRRRPPADVDPASLPPPPPSAWRDEGDDEPPVWPT